MHSRLLPLAHVVTPSTLTIETNMVKSTYPRTVPQIDFTSFNNFAVFTESEESGYSGANYPLLKAVQRSLTSRDIPTLQTQWPNATWSFSLYGPALRCEALPAGDKTRDYIIDQLGTLEDLNDGYAAWSPTNLTGNTSLPCDCVNPLQVPLSQFTNTSQSEFPMSLFVFVATPNDTSITRCMAQNVSFTAVFEYVDGVQNITVHKSPPVGNATSFSAFNISDLASYLEAEPLRATQVAYEAIMDAFTSTLIGVIYRFGTRNTSVTSMPLTALFHAEELRPIYTKIVAGPAPSAEGSAVDLLEEMFTNCTITLMSESLLK